MNFSKISLALSIGGALFAFYGMLKLILFYHAFGIEILYFLELSELLMASLEGIIKCFLYVLPLYIFLSAFLNIKNLRNHPDSIRGFLEDHKLFSLITVLSIFALFGYQIYDSFSLLKYFRSELMLSILGIIVMAFFAPLAANKTLIFCGYRPLKFRGRLFIFLSIFIGVFYIGQALRDLDVIFNGYFSRTNIYFDNGDVLNGSMTQYYIGNTNNYLFYFDGDSPRTKVYRMKDVKRIDF